MLIEAPDRLENIENTLILNRGCKTCGEPGGIRLKFYSVRIYFEKRDGPDTYAV
jgi:hypothetical protein